MYSTTFFLRRFAVRSRTVTYLNQLLISQGEPTTLAGVLSNTRIIGHLTTTFWTEWHRYSPSSKDLGRRKQGHLLGFRSLCQWRRRGKYCHKVCMTPSPKHVNGKKRVVTGLLLVTGVLREVLSLRHGILLRMRGGVPVQPS